MSKRGFHTNCIILSGKDVYPWQILGTFVADTLKVANLTNPVKVVLNIKDRHGVQFKGFF